MTQNFGYFFIVSHDSALKAKVKTFYCLLISFPFQRYDHLKFRKPRKNCENRAAPLTKVMMSLAGCSSDIFTQKQMKLATYV